MIVVVKHFHRKFDVVREQEFDIIRGESSLMHEQCIKWRYVEPKLT